MREMAESLPRAAAASLHVYAEPDRDPLHPVEVLRGRQWEFLSLKLRPLSLIYANLLDDEDEEIILLAWRPRELGEGCRRPPCPVRPVGAA